MKLMKTLALSANVALLAGTAAMATDLVYNNGLPLGHPSNQQVALPFAEYLKEATGGEYTMSVNAGGALGGVRETLAAIETGAVDVGLIGDFYTPALLPNSTMISDLAILGKDTRVMTAAANENLQLGCENCLADYDKNHVVPLLMYSTSPYFLMCKDVSPKEAADVQGLRIRATGAIGQLIAGIGANPVNISSAEQYEALQRNSVECLAGSVPWLDSYSLMDLVTDITDMPLGTFHGTVVLTINKDVWEEFTPETRQIFIDGLASRARAITEVYEKDDASVRATAEEKGIKFVEPGQTLLDAVAAFECGAFDTIMETAKGRGVEDPSPDVENFKKIVAKWSGIVNEIGTGTWGDAEWDAYEEALKTEIFSKMSAE